MFHLIAWSEAFAAAGTLQPVAAVPDDQIFTDGDDVRVPTGLSALLGAYALGASTTRARIVAPSLRAFINYEIAPVRLGASPSAWTSAAAQMRTRSPLPLAVGEFVNFESDGGGLGWLADGPVQPVEQEFRTARATATIAGTQRAWVSGELTFSEDLPAGRYQVVGAQCAADNPGAFRLIFREGGPRPGGISGVDLGETVIPGQRNGGGGVWGGVDVNQPPKLEVLSLGGAGTAQTLYLDLARVGR